MNLRRVVREVLREFMSDGDIDEVVSRPRLTFSDAAALIAQRGTKEPVSILKVIFPSSDTASLLAAWIAQPDRDAELEAKDGRAELLRLISARIGLSLPDETSIDGHPREASAVRSGKRVSRGPEKYQAALSLA